MTPPSLTQIKTSGSAQPSDKPGYPQELFSRFARNVSALTAHPLTFVAALVAVAAWALSGPIMHYSETWQLWINTSTTVITFLMVFLLQNAQTRDTRALHVKMDELLRAVQGARNELIAVENLTEAELDQYCAEFDRMHRHYYSEAIRRRTQTQ